ncbi:hypothetical protein GGS21DRAFT_494409 [Xylaria nigripes]|nr:hypothetical protein GGS21DRAFT_494409 [Xylaria nigripes]
MLLTTELIRTRREAKKTEKARSQARSSNRKKNNKPGESTCHRSFAMPQSSILRAEASPRSIQSRTCDCGHCHSELRGQYTAKSFRQPGREADSHGPRDRVQSTVKHSRQPERKADCRRLSDRSHEKTSKTPPVEQIYVHPYSIHHYRFAVVDHSSVCRDLAHNTYPVCSVANVPEAASVRDIEAVLVPRPGLVAMVRLLSTQKLIRISTFPSIKPLYEAAMQLEVWDVEPEENYA